MADTGSVTGWLHQLIAGDRQAAEALWNRYFSQLERLAKKHLGSHPRRALDEEDVAVSVFRAFCVGAERGRFPELHDRDNLWRLLVVITARKAADHVKYEGRRKALRPGSDDQELLADVIGREPTPEFALRVTEECERLLARLGDETLRQVAVGRLEGYSQQELADRLGVSLRTIERKMQLIRAEWGSESVAD
jgi:DNA-directed RNA polymerase specialized sigma24 family protein